ncbi:MAG: YdcF family protein [Salinivirgaceae bacterium]|jgi:SanA protein|nr:YdcF family protein [Salinivirgaceae bacterium]
MIKLSYKIIISISFFLVALFFVPDLLIHQTTKNKIFSSVDEITYNKVGLLLGTSKYIRTGEINLYYKYRIDAAVKLFESGKIDYILISGDNGLVEYNEPKTIRNDLIERGIPAKKIYLDYAGFRTWDSVIRAKKVFGESKLTVISQEFHNARAIFIGQRNDMDLIGFNAKNVPYKYGKKIRLREKFARINLLCDILVNKQPKYLGTTIEIK